MRREKNKKKALLVLAVGMMLGLLVCLGGCGERAPQAGSGEKQPKAGRGVVRNEDGRIILTLDTIYRGDDEQLRRIVSDYNLQSEEYYVKLTDLAKGTEDYAAVEERWLTDMILGNGSDIVDVSADKNVLGTAGMLADLYEFQPKEQWQQEYVSNIVEAVETSGSLYAIGPQFNLYTVAANGELVDPEGGWTMQEMMDAFAEHGKGAGALGGFSADESSQYTDLAYIDTLSRFAMDDYIDWSGRKADFQTEEFYRFLEFAREREDAGENGLGIYDGIAEGEYLATFEIINSVTDYQIIKELYGGNVALKGFPTAKGSGIAIQMFDKLGVYAGSPCKAGAWDFLQYYLENYGADIAFPVKQDKLEADLAESMENRYEDDNVGRIPSQPKVMAVSAGSDPAGEDGERKIVPRGSYSGGAERGILFFVYAATEEDVAEMREIIARADREHELNQTVQNIICEEMESCIKGDMPVKTVAANIDNRVNLYLKEQEPLDLEIEQGREAASEEGQAEGAQSSGVEDAETQAGSGPKAWNGGKIAVNSVQDFCMEERAYYPHITADHLYALPWEEGKDQGQGEVGSSYQYYIYRRSLRTGEFTREPITQSLSEGIGGMGVIGEDELMYLTGSMEDENAQYLIRGDVRGNMQDTSLPTKANTKRDADGGWHDWMDLAGVYDRAGGGFYLLCKGFVPDPEDVQAVIETYEIREYVDNKLTEKCLQVKHSSAYGSEKYLGIVEREDGFYTMLQKGVDGLLCLEKRDPDTWDIQEIVTELEVPEYTNCVFAADEEGNMYAADEEKLYRFNENTKTFEEILAWQDVNVPGRNIKELAAVDGDSFVVLWESDNQGMLYIATVIN